MGLHASGPKNCMCPLVWPITYPAQKFPIVPRTHSGDLPPILGRGGCLNNPPHGLIYKYNVWSRYIFNRQITVFYQIPFNDLMGAMLYVVVWKSSIALLEHHSIDCLVWSESYLCLPTFFQKHGPSGTNLLSGHDL